MAVTEDQRVNSCRVDLQQLEIVDIDIRGEPVIEQVASRLAALRRLDMQREPPFAFERLALRRSREAGALHLEAGAFERGEEDVVLVVGDLANYDAVDHRRINVFRRRSS